MVSNYNNLKDGDYFIYAEYCPGLFGFAYMGWWLYAAPIVEGEPDKEKAVWLKRGWGRDAVLSGLRLSDIGKGGYTESFREKYPAGVFCKVNGFGYDCKVTKTNHDEISLT
jgi:hypothetical protein